MGSSDVLTLVYYALTVLALVGTAAAAGVLVGGRVHRKPAWLLGMAALTMLLGCVVNFALGSAYAGRYSSVAVGNINGDRG